MFDFFSVFTFYGICLIKLKLISFINARYLTDSLRGPVLNLTARAKPECTHKILHIDETTHYTFHTTNLHLYIVHYTCLSLDTETLFGLFSEEKIFWLLKAPYLLLNLVPSLHNSTSDAFAASITRPSSRSLVCSFQNAIYFRRNYH